MIHHAHKDPAVAFLHWDKRMNIGQLVGFALQIIVLVWFVGKEDARIATVEASVVRIDNAMVLMSSERTRLTMARDSQIADINKVNNEQSVDIATIKANTGAILSIARRWEDFLDRDRTQGGPTPH